MAETHEKDEQEVALLHKPFLSFDASSVEVYDTYRYRGDTPSLTIGIVRGQPHWPQRKEAYGN